MSLQISLIAPLLLAGAVPEMHAPLLNAAGAQEAPDTDVVAIRRDAADRMTVPVRIGKNGPFRFLIDTGAENTVVSSELVQRLALPPGNDARLVGIAGFLPVKTVSLDEIGLGRRNYYGLRAPVLEAQHIGADGIIGLDSLQDQRVLIDFRRNVIAIDEAKYLGGDSGYEIVVTARRRSGQLIVTDARIDRVRAAVVIDTGSDTTVGNRALMAALGKRGAQLLHTELTSVTGQTMQADLALARNLDVQGISLSNVLIAFVDSPAFTHLGLDKKPAVLLGMRELRLFPRVAIDFKTRKVLFDLPAEAKTASSLGSRQDSATRIP